MNVATNDIIKDWTIYKITSPSNAVYVGVSSGFKKRMQYYKNLGSSVIHQKILYASLLKYGLDSHLVETIETFSSNMDYALGKEMFWIRSFMTNSIKYRHLVKGMNLTDGGQGTIGYKASDEHRKRLSEIHKAKPNKSRLGSVQSEEVRKKVSEGLKRYYATHPHPKQGTGKPKSTIKKEKKAKIIKPPRIKKIKEIKPKWDRHHTDESKLKMSLSHIGKPTWNKGKKMSPEYCKNVSLGQQKRDRTSYKYKKIEGTDEERKIKFGSHNIGNNYNKGRKHSPEIIAERSKRMMGKSNVKLNKPILQYDLNGNFIKEFESSKSARLELGVSTWFIDCRLHNKLAIPSKFIFKFKEQ